MQMWIDFMHAHAGWVLAFSLISFVIGIISTPFIVSRIPMDYFVYDEKRAIANDSHHVVMRWLLACLKNMLGAILVVAGIIMLVTPGQGVLSILFGLMIMNYPGKYQLERWIIRRPVIFQAVNALRAKQGQPPLQAPLDH